MKSRRPTGLLGVALLLAASCSGGNDTPEPATTVTTTTIRTTVVDAPLPPSTTPATTRSPATTAPPAPNATAARVNLRTIDWLTALRGINLLKVDTAAPGASNTQPRVEVASANGLAGFAMLNAVDYGDLNGDGQDEAVVSLFSGGTAGNTGILVFNWGTQSAQVELTGPIEFYRNFGYKTGATFKNAGLALTNVIGAGWEPNCCFSGTVTRNFKIVNGLLVQQGVAGEEGAPGARSMTIERFYSLINAKNYNEAYTYFTPAQQARQPFESWKAGYANTKSVEATSDVTDAVGPVKFKLVAVDTSAGGDLRRTFTGTWTLTYSTARHQWLLDAAQIQLGG